jgi:GNAT superfamily N-acetyltransferase
MCDEISGLRIDAAASKDELCTMVRTWLREFNHRANPTFMTLRELPEHQPRELVLLACEESQFAGGLIGQTQFDWLKIDIMAVDPARRGRGIGTALVAAAEREAAIRGCQYAYVDTMSYQAPGFYQRLGYNVAGELPNWDSHGHGKFFLFKRLTRSGAAAETEGSNRG